MFFKKQKACFHQWEVSDFRVVYSDFRVIYYDHIEADIIYELTCKQCKKKRIVNEYEYDQIIQ